MGAAHFAGLMMSSKTSSSTAAKAPTANPARTPAITGAQLATAFEGQLEPRRLSVGYHIGLAAIAVMMVLLPLVYLGIIGGACWAVWYHATHHVGMFAHVRGRAAAVVGIV